MAARRRRLLAERAETIANSSRNLIVSSYENPFFEETDSECDIYNTVPRER